MVIIFHIWPSRRRGYHAVFEVQGDWEILPKMFFFKDSKNYKYLVKSKPLCYSLCCVLFYSALLEKTYSAFVSPLYLKNSPGRIIFEKLNFVKKGSPKKFSTPLFSCGPVIIWTFWCEKNTWKIEKSSISSFYDFFFGQKQFLTKKIYNFFF